MGSKVLLKEQKILANARDFPSLKYAFEYRGCDFTENTITCPISGVVLQDSNLQDNNGGFRVQALNPPPSIPLVAPGTKNTMMIIVLNVIQGTEGFSFGDNLVIDGFMAGKAGTTKIISTAGNWVVTSGASWLAVGDGCAISAIDWTNNTYSMYAFGDTQTSVAKTTPGTPTGTGIIGGFTQTELDKNNGVNFAPVAAAELKGCYVFYFDGDLPTDMENICVWMSNNPGYICPTLIGK